MTSGASSTCDVTRTHLELRGAESLRPVRRPHASATVRRLYPIGAAEYRALYSLVGERWFWHDRLVWTDDELGAYLAAPNVHVWLLGVENRTAGYFELQEHGNAVASHRLLKHLEIIARHLMAEPA